MPRSSTGCVVDSPTPDSFESDPADVELLPALGPVLLSTAESSVELAEAVVIAGAVEKPDVPEAGAWQALIMASSSSRGWLGLIRRILARRGPHGYPGEPRGRL